MSVHEPEIAGRPSATGVVADFLATFAIVGGVVSLAYYPGRLGTGAVVIALLAAALGGVDRRLVPASVAITSACWFLGMVIAVALNRPIF